MRKILVDSSVWITYFKSLSAHSRLDELIRKNQICTNDLILSELIPFIHAKNEKELLDLLLALPREEMKINWEVIMNVQIQNLKNGVNKIGIPDLMIIDHVMTHNLILYSEDKHFRLMQKYIKFDLIR